MFIPIAAIDITLKVLNCTVTMRKKKFADGSWKSTWDLLYLVDTNLSHKVRNKTKLDIKHVMKYIWCSNVKKKKVALAQQKSYADLYFGSFKNFINWLFWTYKITL